MQVLVLSSSVVRPPLYVRQPILDFLIEVRVFFSIGVDRRALSLKSDQSFGFSRRYVRLKGVCSLRDQSVSEEINA